MFDIRRLAKLCEIYFQKTAAAICTECGTKNDYLDPDPNYRCRLCKERANMFSGQGVTNKKEDKDTVPALPQDKLIYEGVYGMGVKVSVPLPSGRSYTAYFYPTHVDTTPSGDPDKTKWKLQNSGGYWTITHENNARHYYAGKRKENKHEFDDMFYNMVGMTSDDFVTASSDEFKKDLMRFLMHNLDQKYLQGVTYQNMKEHFDWVIDNSDIKIYKK